MSSHSSQKNPMKEAINLLRERIPGANQSTDISDLIELCISTYFQFDGQLYGKIKGAAMGSPLSPALPNIFMEIFETAAIESSDLKPKCWYRYVGDTFIIWPHGRTAVQGFYAHINSQHRNIKFTMEVEENGKMPFLDVAVIRKNN